MPIWCGFQKMYSKLFHLQFWSNIKNMIFLPVILQLPMPNRMIDYIISFNRTFGKRRYKYHILDNKNLMIGGMIFSAESQYCNVHNTGQLVFVFIWSWIHRKPSKDKKKKYFPEFFISFFSVILLMFFTQ